VHYSKVHRRMAEMGPFSTDPAIVAYWSMSALVPGRVKTKSNLVVALSGGGIFAYFCSERDHKSQNSGCGYTA